MADIHLFVGAPSSREAAPTCDTNHRLSTKQRLLKPPRPVFIFVTLVQFVPLWCSVGDGSWWVWTAEEWLARHGWSASPGAPPSTSGEAGRPGRLRRGRPPRAPPARPAAPGASSESSRSSSSTLPSVSSRWPWCGVTECLWAGRPGLAGRPAARAQSNTPCLSHQQEQQPKQNPVCL